MLETIKGLFSRVDRAGAQQKQREAMIDLLIWTMYADNVLTVPENDRIDEVAEELTADAAMPLRQYVGASIARIRDVLHDQDQAEVFLTDIYHRLGDDDMRRKAYDACNDLAQVDGVIADEETQFLDRIRTRFHINRA